MLFGVQSWLIHNLNDISNQAAITLIRKRSSFARPYMERLISFRRAICPSVWPFHGVARAVHTTARS
jgi:hypothetical protein